MASYNFFSVYFSPFNIIFNYWPTRRTISYYEIIMKYHPGILYAKYNFVRRVGRHLKIKKRVQKWSKIDQIICKICSIYGSSACCHGNACRINEVLVLVFKRRDIWLFLGIVFSPKFQNLFSAKSEAKNRP